ncbi:MAG: DUF4416 family protein [Planctomycetes bacterium]|nr:DUF4416 family protein [Planctomycetota bacterium]
MKLFCGLLSGDADLLKRTRQLLGRRYGPVDLESNIWPFDQTDYYEPEMGPNLSRRFLSFERPIGPDGLAEIKRETNALETRIGENCLRPDVPRPVNIDPGYLDLGKLVLATTKDRSHRIYLGAGIYAEVTLHYMEHAWQPWPWTYPDYRRPEYHEFFERVRERFREQLRRLEDVPAPPRETEQ